MENPASAHASVFTSVNNHAAVDDYIGNSLRVLMWFVEGSHVNHLFGIKHSNIGYHPFFKEAPIGQPEAIGGSGSHLADSFF